MFNENPQATAIDKNPDSVHHFNEQQNERPPHLDVVSLMKEKNCYFVHVVQVTDNLDVSANNKSADTKKLSIADKLDILYAANPALSTSTLRPNTQDGTFQGGFGVIFSQGEIISANQSDDGTLAKSLHEREIIGGAKNTVDDITKAIERKHGGEGKSYNEIVLVKPEVAGGFMKIDSETYKKRIHYKDEIRTYGDEEGDVIRQVGILDLTDEVDRYGNKMTSFSTPFSTLLEMKSRGPVFFMSDANELLQVTSIDEKTKKVTFGLTPISPQDIAEVYGDKKINKYTKQEMVDRLQEKGVLLAQ